MFNKDCARREILKFISNAKDEDVINDAIDIKFSLLELINHEFANCENEMQLKRFIATIKTLFFVKNNKKKPIEIEPSMLESEHDEGFADRETRNGEKIADQDNSAENISECVLSHMIMWL